MNVAKRLGATGFVAAVALAFGAAPSAQAAATASSQAAAFYLRYTCLCDSVPHAQEALDLASGYLNDVGPINGIAYPAGLLFALDSVIGASGVNSHLEAVPDGIKITLIGVSQGAIVLDYVKQSLALHITPNRPSNELSFVTLGDPMNTTGGIVAKNPLLWLAVPPGPLPTPYNTTEIVREYDGLADWPDRPTVLSVMNALLGTVVVHPDYGTAADPRNPGTVKTVTTNVAGGTTTHFLVRTAALPITASLRAAGIDTSTIDAWLRPQIDSSYDRPERPSHLPASVESASDGEALRPRSAASPRSTALSDSRAATATAPKASTRNRLSRSGQEHTDRETAEPKRASPRQ